MEPGCAIRGRPVVPTQRDFESAFWRPTAADDKIYEQWILSGSRNAAPQASAKGAWK
jgi:trimethylamine:corrinoid methyltransferase-like protein